MLEHVKKRRTRNSGEFMPLAAGSTDPQMRVLLAGNFRFNASEANSLRVRGMVHALHQAGHQAIVLDNGGSLPGSPSPKADYPPLLSVDEYASGLGSTMPRGLRGLFLGDVSVRRAHQEHLRPDCVIMHGPHLGYLLRFRRLCRDLGVPLVLDIVEWYQPEDLPGGRFGPYALANEFSMRHATLLADGVIAISRRLEDHYRRQGRPVINIPPLFEPEPGLATKTSARDGRLHLCYAGSPGRKEAFDLTLSALQRLADAGVAFTLHLVGMTAKDLGPWQNQFSICRPDKAMLHFHGRVPNARARDIVAAADFTLLLRPQRRSNQFGFPSKLAESMAVGTPVIANDFSDLDLHLIDGENAIFEKSLDKDAVFSAFRRAASMSAAKRRLMSEQALATAQANFSPSAVSRKLSSFLQDLK